MELAQDDSPHTSESHDSGRAGKGLCSLSMLLGIALLLRVVWAFLVPVDLDTSVLVSDQGVYQEFALSIASGNGYSFENGDPGGWWPVGYSALLAAGYSVFGVHAVVAVTINILLGLLLVASTWQIGRVFFGDRVGFVAGLCMAIHPTFVMYVTTLGSENASVPLGLAFVAVGCTMYMRSGRTWLRALFCGITLAAAVYVRPTALAFVPILFLFDWMRSREFLRAGLYTGIAAVTCLVLLIPWGLRNRSVFGSFQLLSLNSGSNLWMGNHEGSTGGYQPVPAEAEKMETLEMDQYLRKQAVAWIKANPGSYVRLCFKRTFDTLKSDTIAAGWNEPGIRAGPGDWLLTPLKVLSTGFHYLLMLGAAVGVFRALRAKFAKGEVRLMVLWVAFSAIPFVFVVGGNRYHLATIPLFALLAATLARTGLPFLGRSRPEPVEPAAPQ